ncbi:ABC transporter permease subunit [Galactobacter valiniphilus]|uniref:ABC transporter permease subunit n=1 Tax=Galactobacter valiniphilus TaxID=2676122 RepID=A0A399JD35_9MICC|nr:ABC transporter permease subunit [Galactobacter valiniphilus]RII41942.1 ABC transporter permease subunit [Galactobacter valiniphilus]
MTLTSAPEQRAAQGLEPPAAPAARRGGAFALRWGGRLLGALVTLWGAATVAFLAQLALPGDRATVIFNIRAGQAIERTPEELASINEQFGLQRPAWQQYVEFLGGLLRGDLGDSYQQFRPVAALIAEQLPSTLALTALALLFAWIIMVLWVTLTAGRAPWLSSVGAVIDTVAAGLPHYWLGILLLVVFAAGLGWFPVISGDKPAGIVLPALTLAIPLAGFMGQSTRTEYENTLKQPFVAVTGPSALAQVLAVAVGSAPGYARMVRAQILQASGSGYVEAALTLGHPRSAILCRHVFPNAIRPLVAILAMSVGQSIVWASSLAFLGLGVSPPSPEWGALLDAGRRYIVHAPWLTVIPGLVIVVVAVASTTIGQHLRLALEKGEK